MLHVRSSVHSKFQLRTQSGPRAWAANPVPAALNPHPEGRPEVPDHAAIRAAADLRHTASAGRRIWLVHEPVSSGAVPRLAWWSWTCTT